MGVLTGDAIMRAHSRGDVYIDPYDSSRVGINSYDVTLSDKLLVYVFNKDYPHLDLRRAHPTEELVIPEEGLLLKKGELYLGSTVEQIGSNRYLPWLDGRSSVGRLGIFIHATAGRGDIGFSGSKSTAATWTLEISVVHDVVVYPNVAIGQVTFLTPEGEIKRLYQGRYSKQSGPVASRFWQSKDKE